MFIKPEDRPRCIFCNGDDLQSGGLLVAGEPIELCKICAGAAAAAFADGACPSGHWRCLHLLAMEIELAIEGMGRMLSRRERKALRRLQNGFQEGFFRMVCACATCTKVQIEADLGLGCFEGPNRNLFEIDGVDLYPELFGLGSTPLALLRSMPPRAKIFGADGQIRTAFEEIERRLEENRQDTALTERDVKALQRRALRQIDRWGRWQGQSAPINLPAERATARHFKLVAKYGAGCRDGDFWISPQGEIFDLAPEECGWPMTAKDVESLYWFAVRHDLITYVEVADDETFH